MDDPLNSGDVLQRKACVEEVFTHYPVKIAYLYGSTARGQATPLSDVDIAVVLDPERYKIEEKLKLELAIEDEIALQCDIPKAEVRIINDAPIIFKGEVITDGVRLYSCDEDFRVGFETRTRMEYFDYLPVANFLAQAHFKFIREQGLKGYGQ